MKKNYLYKSSAFRGLAIFASVGALSIGASQAAILVALTGTPGSNVISYEVSGSITIQATTIANSSVIGKIPYFDGTIQAWNSTFDNNLGDVYQTGSHTSTQNDDLVLSTGIALFKNVEPSFGTWDTIDLDSATGDDVEFDPTSTIDNPALAIGDTFSASGSGTFTLEVGTFDTVFNEGTYQRPNDLGTYEYSVTIVSIPEPSSALMIALFGGLGLLRRRRA